MTNKAKSKLDTVAENEEQQIYREKQYEQDTNFDKSVKLKDQQLLPDVTDKGYAWVVIAVMFTTNVVTAGYIKSFGIMYNAIVDMYPGTSAAAGSVIMGLLAGCRCILAPVVGAAALQFGYRPTMLFGSVLCSLALFISYFCTSIAALAVTLGAMMGIGMCCIETSQVVVLSDYFNKNKELANSIRVAGNPLGGAALPFLLVMLFEHFGLKLSYIILSALLLQLSVLICLIRPYKTQQKIIKLDRIQELRGREMVTKDEHAVLNFEAENQQISTKSKLFDLKLFVNPLYLTHISMIVFLSIALPQLQYFVPIFGRTINLTPEENSIVLAHQSVFDSACRLSIGLMLNKKMFKKTHAFIACLLVGGLGICLIPFTRGLWSLLAAITVFSVGSSGYFATINVILIDQFGKNNVASSWGFIRMVQGILNFVYPSLLGLMADVTGNYFLTFFTMGIGMALGGVSIALQPFVARRTKKEVTFL